MWKCTPNILYGAEFCETYSTGVSLISCQAMNHPMLYREQLTRGFVPLYPVYKPLAPFIMSILPIGNNGEKVEGDHVRLHCTRMLPPLPSPFSVLAVCSHRNDLYCVRWGVTLLTYSLSSHIFWPKTQNRFNFIDVRRLHASCSK